MKLQFIGSCVDNPFLNVEILSKIIDDSKGITRRTFLKHCDIRGNSLMPMSLKFPNDFTYHKNIQKYKGFKRVVYFFTNSCIEYFYA